MALSSIFKKVIRKAGLINYLVLNNKVKIGAQEIRVPEFLGLRCNLTETWMIALLENLLRIKEGAFIDIGVNLGQTLIKVKGLEPCRPYIGFEPNPSCVFYAKEMIKRNSFKDCSIFPVGLFTENKVLSLECISNTEVDSSASIIQNFRGDRKIYHQIPVPVFRFQDLISNVQDISQIGIIKVDVEGAELEVIESLKEAISQYRPILLLEVLPVYSNENDTRLSRQNELEYIFSELNYSIFRISKFEEKFSSLKRIDNIGIHSNLDECDYVVAPDELATDIETMVAQPTQQA